MKTSGLLVLSLLAAPQVAGADEPMMRSRVPGERDVIVAAPAPPPPPSASGGYVCEIEMIGSKPDRPFGGMQVYFTPQRNCGGDGQTYVAWISDRPTPGDPAFSEAHVLAMQRDLVIAAREGWIVYVDHDPDRAVIKQLKIRMR
jgi:hypothetical protein